MAEKSEQEVHDLILNNLGLAYSIAASWQDNVPSTAPEDVRAQAIHGLVKAANEYDATKGKFSSFAGQIIRNYLGHLKYWQKAKSKVQATVLDAPIGDDEGGDSDATLHDKLPGKSTPADVSTGNAEAKALVRKQMAKLEPKEREILQRWLSGESYRDMQADFGVSFATIGNIAKAALAKVKSGLKSQGISGLDQIWSETLWRRPGKLVAESLYKALSETNQGPKADPEGGLWLVWVKREGKWEKYSEEPMAEHLADKIADQIRRQHGGQTGVRVTRAGLTPIDLG
jgi:RNA polymerase sigma factor (sigma-70 family)